MTIFSAELPNWAEALTAVLSSFTLIAVGVAYAQILNLNRQMHREFEMQYLRRFWELMDRRSNKFKVTGKPAKTDRAMIQDYLSLCEDQIDLRALGRVTDHTWKFWRTDIRKMCMSAPIYAEYQRAGADQYQHIGKLIGDCSYDPLQTRGFWRKLQGL